MEFHEAADFLHDLRRFRMRPGTASTAALLARAGDPQSGYDVVQVAGSNGKGSTARMVERVLRAAGLDVGLYTSPHLDEFRERVRVNGREIPERAVVAFVEAVGDHVDDRAAAGDPPTFFEVVTAMAFWQFGRADVDVAVVEVGIGGRHDATSAVEPVASAVVDAALEHTDILGETVEEIARDMAAVAPVDAPLVTGATGEARAALSQSVDALTVVGDGGEGDGREGDGGESDGDDVTATYGGVVDQIESRVTLDGPGWHVDARLPLPGRHQARNAGVAAALARQVGERRGVTVDEATLARGLRGAHWPGRFEVVETDPLVVLDGAHNPAACAAVAATLAEYEYDDLALVFGAMNDKDHAGMAAALPRADRAYLTRPALDRAESPPVLARAFADRAGRVRTVDDVSAALDAAIDAAGPDDCVLVTGSLYVVAAARDRWTRTAVPKEVRDPAEAREAFAGAGVRARAARRLADHGVHRTLELRVRRGEAERVRAAMLAAGGECGVGAGDGPDREPVDVVATGTLAQFREAIETLRGAGGGLVAIAERLRAALHDAPASGGEPANPRGRYPWERARTAVMGIVNVTPDSFHDGGEYDTTAAAVERAERQVAAGADVVDVGGESTNPAADPTPADVERERVLPVIEALAERDLDAPISVDTRKASVAVAALDAGADLINDVSGLADPAMRFVAAEHDAPVVVMHSIDAPVDPDTDVEYDDVVGDVIDDLRERVLLAEKAGLDRSKVLVDPGLGFGKSAAESWELLGRAGELRALGCPVLIGHSRKSMLGAVGRYPDEGGYATTAATALAAAAGADVVRVHDVPENVAAVRAASAARWGVGGEQ